MTYPKSNLEQWNFWNTNLEVSRGPWITIDECEIVYRSDPNLKLKPLLTGP